jgi:hypothetical protein
MVNIIGNILANTLADKNRGLSPSMATLWHPIVRHRLLTVSGDTLANILADKNRVYVPLYDRQNVISIGRIT